MAESLEQIGARIRGHRKAQKLTQAILAARVGIHTTYLSDVERGAAANVSLSIILRIGRELGIPLANLIDTGTGDSAIEEGLAIQIQQLRQLPETKQKSVLRILDRIIPEVEAL